MELGVCIGMLSKLPMEQRLELVARVGLGNVEIGLVDRSFDGGPEELAQLAGRCGVRIINTVIGSPDGSIGGGLTNPHNRSQWLRRAEMSIAYTRRAGIPGAIVCTGNVVDGMTDKQMMKSVLAGLKATVDLAENAGVNLLLEPLNTTCDHAGYWLTSSDRAAEICRGIGSERLRLLFDCYHQQIMEGDLLVHIERNLDVIGHFHSAGVPGRNELFKGEINYPFLLERVESLGYEGVFGLEYRPSIDPERSLRKTLEYLKLARDWA